MADYVTLRCPNLKCRVVLRVPGSKRGECVRCGVCGNILKVPRDKSGPLKPPVKQVSGP